MNRIWISLLALAGLLHLCLPEAEAQTGSPDSAAYYFDLGKASQASGRFNDAWIFLDKAAAHEPQNAGIQLAIANVCMKLPRREAPGIRALEKASSLLPTDYALQWRLVNIYFDNGKYDRVIGMLPTLREHMEETPGWAYMLGKSYYSVPVPNYGKAIPYLDASLKEEGATNSEAAYMLARMYLKMEDHTKAIQYYERALTPDCISLPSRTYEFGCVQLFAQQYESAIKSFKLAMDRGYEPRDDFYEHMADAYANAGQRKEAISIIKSMLHRRPQDKGLLNTLANLFYQNKQFEEAFDCWDHVLELIGEGDKPAYASKLYQVGSAYDKMGDTKNANLLRDRAIQMYPPLGQLKHQQLK